MMGGRLKLCVSGGGPISADIQNFIRVGFNVNLIQGYGLTETCAAGTVQPPFNAEDGVAGAPISAVGARDRHSRACARALCLLF
jgi:long-chain acyl-CoA synthetase